jgi:hypothetical protein
MKSKSGQGTTAELWLFIAEINEFPASVAETPPPTQVPPLVVMAVDGDGVVFMNTVLMFEDLLHTVLEASSGEEALRLLVQGRFPTPDY